MNLGWAGKSLAAAFFYVPVLLAVGFLAKNYAVRPEATLFWYFIGITIGVAGGLWSFGIMSAKDFAPNVPLLIILATGMTFGAASNILMFQALSAAPNPGLPLAMVSTSSVIVFVVAIGCAAVLPKLFDTVRFDAYHFLGIVLTVIGVALIALKR